MVGIGLALLAVVGVRAAAQPCADLLAQLNLRGRAAAPVTWVRGGLINELGNLVRSARRPGQLTEEARIFRPSRNDWATPPHVARPGVDDSKLYFDTSALLGLARGGILVHTHPIGLFSGRREDQFRFALPSADDVRLAERLQRDASARFLIVSPHFITETIVNAGGRRGVRVRLLRDLRGGGQPVR